MCSNFCHVLKNIRINNQDVPAILAHPDFIVELAVANLQGRCFSELGCGSREFAYHGYQHLEALLGFYGVVRSGAPMEVIENLQEIEDEGESYESIEEIWSDYPTKEDFFFNEDEY